MNINLTRSVLVIILPGAIILAPFIVVFLVSHAGYIEHYKTYKKEVFVIAVGISVVVGMLAEGISTYIEVYWDNSYEETEKLKDHWFRYLAAQYENEPVGYKYISNRVTTMYFEFGMMWSSAVGSVGWAWVLCLSKPNSFSWWSTTTLVFGLLSAFFFYRLAKSSHRLLCDAREKINEINEK